MKRLLLMAFASLAMANLIAQPNVGVGTTTPLYKLHVHGDAFVNSSQGSYILGYPGADHKWHFSTTNGGQDLLFRSETNTGAINTRMYMTQGGLLGVGTSTPGATLEVSSPSPQAARFLGPNQMYVSFVEAGNYRGYIGSYSGNVEDVDFGTGLGSTGKVHLVTGASPKLTIQSNGNVGIGTTTPTEASLQVHEPAGNTQFIAAAGNNLPGISTFVPVSSPSLGFNVRYQSGYKFMGTGYGGFFQYSPSAGKLYYYYSSTTGAADGSVSSVFALAIDSSGRLGIGVSSPTAPLHVTGNVVFGGSTLQPAAGYKVSIDGKAICEELKVQLSGSWPDYVFDSKYALLPLDELEEKVMREKHLPGILPASQVELDKGFEVGDMQKRFLEKMEEMYRYMFEMNRENKALKAKVEKTH